VLPTALTRFNAPAVAGVVYVGADFPYALNAGTGKTIWRAGSIDYPASKPAIAHEFVYYSGSPAQRAYAVNAANGKTLWSSVIHNYGFSSTAFVNGRLYVGSEVWNLYAFGPK
jgi:outer membrane protein assembly factor BamB